MAKIAISLLSIILLIVTPIPNVIFLHSHAQGEIGSSTIRQGQNQQNNNRNPELLENNNNRGLETLASRNNSDSRQQSSLSMAPPINISKSNDAQLDNPKIAIGENGHNIYVVWQDNSNNYRILFSRSTDGGETFSKPVVINSDGQGMDPQVAVQENNLYLAWEDLQHDGVGFTRSTDGGETFSNETVLGKSDIREVTNARIATFGNDNVYVLLFNSDSTHNARVLLARSNDGGETFKEPVVVTTNETKNDALQEPVMTINENGIIYVAWFEGDRVSFKRSTDGGTTFTKDPVTLFNPTGCSYDLVVSSSQNNVYAACVFKNEEVLEGSIPGTRALLDYQILLYSGSTDYGATFSDTVSLTNKQDENANMVNEPFISSTGSDAYIGYSIREKDVYVIRISDNQTQFHEPVALTNNTQFSNFWVNSVKAAGDKVSILWSERPKIGGGDNQSLFFTASFDKGSSFQPPIMLSQHNNSYEPSWTDIAIAGDNSNDIYLVWESSSSRDSNALHYTKISIVTPNQDGYTNANVINRSSSSAGVNVQPSQKFKQEQVRHGISLYKQGNFTGAISLYEQAIQLDESYGHAWYDKGLALTALGRYREAIDSYDKALQIDPNNSDASHARELAQSKLLNNGNSSSNNQLQNLDQQKQQPLLSVTPTINISKSNVMAFDNPKIAVGENGRDIYTVWQDGNGKIIFSRSTDGGSTFSEPVTLNPESYGQDPQISVQGNNNLYVAWGKWGVTGLGVGFSRSTDGGSTFSNMTTVGNSTNEDIDKVKLATLSNDRVYLLLFSDATQSHRVMLARSTDGGSTFSEPIVVTTNQTETDVLQEPQLAISDNGTLYVAWFDDGKILFSKSTDGGATFSEKPITLFNPTGCTDGLVMSTSKNNVYLACSYEGSEEVQGNAGTIAIHQYRVLLYTGSTDYGNTFSDTVSLTKKQDEGIGGATLFAEHPVIFSTADDTYIGYNLRDKNIFVIRISDNQTKFHQPVAIGSKSTDSIFYVASLKASGNNVYVLWHNLPTNQSNPSGESLFFTASFDKGSSFQPPIRLSQKNAGLDSSWIDMAVTEGDSNNNIYLVWKTYNNQSPYVIQYTKISTTSINQNGHNNINSTNSLVTDSRNPSKQELLQQGVSLYKQGNFTGAISLYGQAIQLDENYTSAWYDKGLALTALGRYREAIESYDKALGIDSNYVKALYNKGNVLYKIGRNEEAIESFDKALQLTPNDVSLLTNKGSALYALGKYQEAIQYYDKALQIDPTHVNALIDKGLALYSLGSYQEAIESYNKVLEIDPNNADASHAKELAQNKLVIESSGNSSDSDQLQNQQQLQQQQLLQQEQQQQDNSDNNVNNVTEAAVPSITDHSSSQQNEDQLQEQQPAEQQDNSNSTADNNTTTTSSTEQSLIQQPQLLQQTEQQEQLQQQQPENSNNDDNSNATTGSTTDQSSTSQDQQLIQEQQQPPEQLQQQDNNDSNLTGTAPSTTDQSSTSQDQQLIQEQPQDNNNNNDNGNTNDNATTTTTSTSTPSLGQDTSQQTLQQQDQQLQ